MLSLGAKAFLSCLRIPDLVAWLSDKQGPFCALLGTSTKPGTDVPWIIPAGFRRGAKKSGVQLGGAEWFCRSTAVSHYALQKENKTSGNKFILFSEGSEQHFNKILVTFMQEPIIPIK